MLAMLTEYPDSRLSTIAEWLDRSPGVVRAALQRLRKRGLVEFVGAPRTGGYRRLAAGPGRHWSPVDDLGAQDLWVLATVGDQPGVRTAALADWLGLSTSAARHTLTRLRKQGLVKFVGPRRTGGWHRAEGVL
ncbi:MAG: MarR family transcriptional regulator [Deltaproteobacteria bacterium]|nr:MAG: MarR family transcriptional regulator [Deltaproteobacteria bacterium]